jgi:hypothetical protein
VAIAGYVDRFAVGSSETDCAVHRNKIFSLSFIPCKDNHVGVHHVVVQRRSINCIFKIILLRCFNEIAGRYDSGDQTLYINVGLGCTAPFRLGVNPEVTVITLKSAGRIMHISEK